MSKSRTVLNTRSSKHTSPRDYAFNRHIESQQQRPYLILYDRASTFSVSIPSARVTQVPEISSAMQSKTTYILCDDYNEGKCNSPTCPFVHADIEGLERHTIHVNYSWQSECSVAYARLPAGETLHVLAPNNRPPTDDIPSERVLVTKGSLSAMQNNGHGTHRPLSHCAHFYFNHVCNRGESCSFIHSVHIDCTASRGQHAPAPAVVHRYDRRFKPADDNNPTNSSSGTTPLRRSAVASSICSNNDNNESETPTTTTSVKPFCFYSDGNIKEELSGCRTMIISSTTQKTVAYRNNPYAYPQKHLPF